MKAECGLCHKKLKMINNAHLKVHGLDSSEYDILYPDYPRYPLETRQGMGSTSTINHELFKTFDYESAWLLGLLTADGSRGGKKTNVIQLYNTEKGLVDEFKRLTRAERKIFERQGMKGQLGKKIVYHLALSSPMLRDTMESLGAYGPKEIRNPFANIPEKYKWSFIKGLFDGDGNCYKGRFAIAGRIILIGEVYQWICKQLDKEPNKLYQATTSEKTHYFQMGFKDSGKVLDLMEANSPGTYNSEKYTTLKNLHKATLGQLQYIAKHTEHRDEALLELDRRIPR